MNDKFPFCDFELERYQSQFERTVEHNLADSSVQGVGMRELVTDAEASELLHIRLNYPEVNGAALLRDRIAALYDGALPGNILVTVGASQANHTMCATLLKPGDEVIVVSPGYRQVWGMAKNMGCTVKELVLDPRENWAFNASRLKALCTDSTKLISVVNPNNPTGAILSKPEMREVVQICSRLGCWLHADEVYRGTELNGIEIPSFWGQYDKVICVNSMSKAYGLAGLRIGWAVAPPDIIEAMWRRHEYFVIAAGEPGMTLAEIALRSEKRQSLLRRQRELSQRGHRILEDWIRSQEGNFWCVRPAATSIAFVGYRLDVPSLEFAEHLRKTSSVLVAPGAFLGMEYHFRMSVGYPAEKIVEALDRVGAAAAQLAADHGKVFVNHE